MFPIKFVDLRLPSTSLRKGENHRGTHTVFLYPPDARNHGPSSPSNYERRSPAPAAGTDVSLWREADSAWQPLRLVDQHEPERKGYLFNNRVPAIFKLATCGKLFELARVHPNLHATSQCIEVT